MFVLVFTMLCARGVHPQNQNVNNPQKLWKFANPTRQPITFKDLAFKMNDRNEQIPRPPHQRWSPRAIPIHEYSQPIQKRFGTAAEPQDNFKPLIIPIQDIPQVERTTAVDHIENMRSNISRSDVIFYNEDESTFRMNKDESLLGRFTDLAYGRKRGPKIKKKYLKYMLPLLLAYKLKFFTLIPVLKGGLILLAGATGLAGFFFALFATVMGLRGGHY